MGHFQNSTTIAVSWNKVVCFQLVSLNHLLHAFLPKWTSFLLSTTPNYELKILELCYFSMYASMTCRYSKQLWQNSKLGFFFFFLLKDTFPSSPLCKAWQRIPLPPLRNNRSYDHHYWLMIMLIYLEVLSASLLHNGALFQLFICVHFPGLLSLPKQKQFKKMMKFLGKPCGHAASH